MIPLPTRRWLWIAAGLAVVAPLALIWPGAAVALIVVDLLWVGAFWLDWSLSPDAQDISVAREAPAAFSVGRSFPVRYRWTRGGTAPFFAVVREERPAPLVEGASSVRRLRVPPEGVTETITIRPTRRGRGSAGAFSLRLGGPLGLAWSQGTIERPWTATVFPDLSAVALHALPTQSARRREAGLRNVRRLGEGRVFETLRDWVPGDDVRSIDWKATARRGKTMARQYEDERRQQVLIVIDAGRMLTPKIHGRPRLESAIDAALQLAWTAIESDDNVGLMVFADTIQHWLPPRRGKRALQGILEALATVEGKLVEPDYPAAFAHLALRNRKRALTVLFTDVIDRTASDALLAQAGTLRPRHLPLAVTFRNPELEALALHPPEKVEEAYERAAAEELLVSRAEALAVVRRRGVLVLDVLPDGAARAVVERYRQLKRRGML
ncbi:MAG: DUF58 domain-containing protein [Gemmatimonadales bacterium]